jgi:hypothetical protein
MIRIDLEQRVSDFGDPVPGQISSVPLVVGPVRISYWLAPGARAVLLTAFRKTRQIERAEVARAIAAQQVCESGHEAHGPATEIYDRKWL